MLKLLNKGQVEIYLSFNMRGSFTITKTLIVGKTIGQKNDQDRYNERISLSLYYKLFKRIVYENQCINLTVSELFDWIMATMSFPNLAILDCLR